MRPLLLATALALTGLLAAAGARAQPSPALDDLLCLNAKPAARIDRALRFTPEAGLTLRNHALGDVVKIDVRKPLAVCLPASIAGGPVTNAATAFEAYGSRLARTRPPQRPAIDVQRLTNRFGSDELRLKALSDVMVQSAAVLDPPPAPASVPTISDDFACWDAERTVGLRGRPAATAPLAVASAIGTWQLDVKAPTRVCFPSDVGGTDPAATTPTKALVCYRAKLTRTKPPQGKPFPREVATTNRFGNEQLVLTATFDLCVPSDAAGVSATATPARTAVPTPTPTLTPPPDFTLKVGPNAATIDIGTSTHFTATAFYKNGNVVDFTERVLWRSSTGAALAPNEAGDRGRIEAVDGGSAVISVLDEATGVASTDTGDDAILDVNWTLQRIELLPVTATRGKGESIRLRATGYFASGFTRPIPERLVYASSASNIALPTNDPEPANRSRVIAADVGVATISATDPLSGVTSAMSSDDVAITVVPPMEYCYAAFNVVGLTVGEHYQFTTTGFYPGGFQRNVTQQVVYASDAPAIVEALNTDGDRSRVLAHALGEANITVTDPVSGLTCVNRPLVRVGAPSALYLQPPDPRAWFPKRAGRSWHAIAIERYAPPVQKDYVTEDVVFTSSAPAIVAAPNVPGDRGRLDAVGSGTALIHATDPRNGFVSQSVPLRSLAGLTRVKIATASTTILDVNRNFFLGATGEFGDGPASLEPTDLVFASDNPAVAEVIFSNGRWRVHSLAPGVATVSATDLLTGISSDAFGDSLRIGVRGPLERIELVPSTVTRRNGEAHPFAALLHYVGGVTEVGTQSLVYASSDPSVAFATNDFYVRGKVNAVAGGTATITATDPVSGVSSADSGGNAVLTVVGPLTRIRVQPDYVLRSAFRSFSFTAIGYDAAGRSTNVTQDVVWASSDPTIAVAHNPEGNRSRIDALYRYEGVTTTISATDPLSGTRSSDSAEDAAFEVKSYLTAVTVSAIRTVMTVGETLQLTATGHLNDRSSINLTQEVEYISSNPSVVRADNTPGDRSRVTALKAGQAFISARDLATGMTTGPNGRVTLVVTAP